MKTRNITVIALLCVAFLSACGLAEKEKLQTEKAKQQAQKDWGQLLTNYQRRSDLISSLIKTAEYTTDADNDIFKRLAATRKKIGEFDSDFDHLSKERFEHYETLEATYSKDLADFLEFIKNYPDAIKTKAYEDFLSQISGTEKRIAQAKENFEKSFDDYNP